MLLPAKTVDQFKLKLTHQLYSALSLWPVSSARTQHSRRDYRKQSFKGYQEKMFVS